MWLTVQQGNLNQNKHPHENRSLTSEHFNYGLSLVARGNTPAGAARAKHGAARAKHGAACAKHGAA
jgi:hypothetical protein